MTPKNIKCNFKSVFAQFNTIEEITELANNICAQVKSAYDARKDELEGTEAVIEAIVEIESETAKEQEAPKETKKASSKTERAKEMAAKFKKEKKENVEAKTESKSKKNVKKETKTESKKEQKTDSSDTLIAITDIASIKKLGLSFEKYNDKCFVLRGNTKPLRKVLKEEFKGVFNSRLTGGEGWVISSKHAQNCAKALGLKVGA